MNIRFLQYLYTALMLLGMCMISSCSDNDEPSEPNFINNAKLQEEGQKLSPGDIVHLEGEGYLETDNVWLNIFWKTGNDLMPEGSITAYYANILTASRNGITIQMPYRKPESRVEVCLLRNGEIMKIGTVYLSDGTTPSQYQLYGIVNHSKCLDERSNQITRWLDSDNGLSDMHTWTLDAHFDFHSTVGAYRTYGICGLSKENGMQYPYFFDLLTGEWKRLSEVNTIALFSDPTAIYALSTDDNKYYRARSISSELEQSNYAVATRASSSGSDLKFTLPEDIHPDFMGDYPGVRYDTENVLLSANKGDGKWTPILFNQRKGFLVSDDIDADALIPFSAYIKTEYSDAKSQKLSGYIVVLREQKDGNHSLFYTIDEDNFAISKNPFTSCSNKVLSVTSNPDRPGTLTVHCEAYRAGNVTFELSLQNNEWTFINQMGSFDEVVWIN
ncbi:MAG: WD40-like domain containing protein [Bacteroides thetaiotaomicron]